MHRHPLPGRLGIFGYKNCSKHNWLLDYAPKILSVLPGASSTKWYTLSLPHIAHLFNVPA